MNIVIASIAGAILVASDASHAQGAAELLKKHNCTTCHAIDKKLVGPAYMEVAARYKGDAKAPAMLMEKVKKGGVGNWGPPPIPMPPNETVPDADIKTMVTYILGLKK